jgi:iron complex outermembrane receptor protein
MKQHLFTLSVLAIAVSMAAPTFAQGDQKSSKKSKRKAKEYAVENVLVEGKRIGNHENGALGNKAIIDTPFSITLVDAEDMAKRGAKSVRQIFINDPSFYTPASSNTTDWWGMSIRGLPVRNTFADDLPILLYWGGDFPTEVVDSVSALKGATGFMYGFGSPGGAVSYQLKKPQDTAKTNLDLGIRSNSIVSVQLDTNQVMGDDFSYRLNLAQETGTAYNAAEVNRSVASFAAEKAIGEKFEWFGNVIYEDSNLKHEPFQFYLDGYDFVGSGGKLPRVSYDYDDFNVDNSFYATETLISTTGFKYHINENWQAKYQYGYIRKEHDSNKSFADLHNQQGDYSGNIYNFAGILANYFNQLMLTGELSTGAISHEAVAGIGYQKATSQYGPFYYASTADFAGNLYQEQTFLMGDRPDLTLNPVGNEVRQTYGFLSDTIKLNTQWQLILGARHTYYDKEDVDRNPAVNSGYNTKAITPTVALLYKPVADATLYASYVEGLEPGSTVGTRYANAGENLDAQVSTQYELGGKYQTGKLHLEISVFDIQRTETMDLLQNGLLYLTQDGLTTFKGIELSSAYQFTENLRLGMGFVNLDASIDDVSEANKALKGNMPANAAKWQGLVNAEYTVAAIDGLSLHGVIRYYGDTYVTNANQLKVPDYTIANAGFSYEFPLWNRNVTLNGNINNIFNKKYWAGGGYGAGNIGEAINASLGLQASW